jgi:hypothetical protein
MGLRGRSGGSRRLTGWVLGGRGWSRRIGSVGGED